MSFTKTLIGPRMGRALQTIWMMFLSVSRHVRLFFLDSEVDMDVILGAIRGLGGIVLKTNVDLERAKLTQSTLAAPSTSNSDGK